MLKKLAAILLIATFGFNLVGYRLVFNYVQQQSDVQLVAALDRNDYNEAELVTISIPTNLPYQPNQSSFERVDGEITYQGRIYKYVKRRIDNGHLILKCLPNHNKMRLQSAKDNFFAHAADLLQHSGQSKKSDNSKSNTSKSSVGDYLADVQVPRLYAPLSTSTKFGGSSKLHLPAFPHHAPWQPPDELTSA